MSDFLENIPINLDFIKKGLTLDISSEGRNAISEIAEEVFNENGEANVKILEGRSYDYEFSDADFRLKTSINGIISHTKSKEHRGRIVPNIYVGTLQMEVFHVENKDDLHKISIEVLATKFDSEPDKSYRENYRIMLESITEKCTDLLMQVNSPVLQNFETNFEEENETIYQRFCFVNSLINSKGFEEALHKIVSSPKTIWTNESEQSDIRKIKRFSSNEIRQLTTSSNRIKVPENHFLYSKGIDSIPSKIFSTKKIENTDNAENRFVKHALEVYLVFCENCFDKFKEDTREKKEAELLVRKLEFQLNQPFFKNISRPQSLKLNSPVLQRKSGYREILNAWLQYDLAAKLIWKGGDDVYKAGKRDIATLYEYWLFFNLYDLFKSKFELNQISHEGRAYDHLLEPTKGGLNIMVKQGKHTALNGNFKSGNRELSITFSYNRSFKGGTEYSQEVSGSYTTTLRPDYTLSVWPALLKESEAEKQELIVHIHFDAKYKVVQFEYNISSDLDVLDEEKTNERRGYYKNADLLKMHAYKDAIRRTGGAYVLYPGTKNKEIRGFHEIIPGLGAFAINPSSSDVGIGELSKFIDLVIKNLVDRASQRENISNKAHLIYKQPKDYTKYLHESLPEYVNGKKLIPDDIFVLVGYSKSPQRFNWYIDNKKYIFRMDEEKGSLELTNEVVNAKYLLIRRNKKQTASDLFRITSKGPKVLSKYFLEENNYPLSGNSKEFYLQIDIEKVNDIEFKNLEINFKVLDKYIEIQTAEKNIYSKVGLPFTVTLTELMDSKVTI